MKTRSQLRRPKRETVEHFNLFSEKENVAPKSAVTPEKTENSQISHECTSRNSGYWLSAEDFNRSNRDPSYQHQYDTSLHSADRSWEAIYDTFYRHPGREQNNGDNFNAPTPNNYRLPNQLRSEDSDLTSDRARSSVSTRSPYETNHQSNAPSNRAPRQHSPPTENSDHCAVHRNNPNDNPQASYHQANRHQARRPTTRARRPFVDHQSPTYNPHRARRALRLPEDTRRQVSQIDIRDFATPRFRGHYYGTQNNNSHESQVFSSAERIFESKLTDVCNQVETLRREFRELRNLTPHRRTHTYPRTHARW